MSHAAGRPEPPISNKTIIKVLAVCFSVIVLTILYSLSNENQNGKKENANKTAITVENTENSRTIEVPLNPETWSDWVELPMNFKSWEFGTNSDWLEFYFLNGEKRSFKADEKFWWKNTPRRTFKLRGATGKATIVVKL